MRSPLGHLSTAAALERLDELFGEARWDAICFSFGVSDAVHKDPRRDEVRAMSPAAGGVPVTPLAAFGPNLVFCSTQIQHGSRHRHFFSLEYL